MENNPLVQKMAKLLWERKASKILALDVRGLTVLCDYMVIASGRNANQVKGLYDDVDDAMAKEGVQLRRSEGSAEGRWVAMIRCMPAARASWAIRQMDSSTSFAATIIRSASSSITMTIFGSFSWPRLSMTTL